MFKILFGRKGTEMCPGYIVPSVEADRWAPVPGFREKRFTREDIETVLKILESRRHDA